MKYEISTKLQSLIDEANASFGKGMDIVLTAYNQPIADGHKPKQAAKILLDNIIAFKKSTIYNYLPAEAKDATKARAGASRKKSVPTLEHITSDKIPTLESPKSVEITEKRQVIDVETEAEPPSAVEQGPPLPEGTHEVVLDVDRFRGPLWSAMRNNLKCYLTIPGSEVVNVEAENVRKLEAKVR